MSTGVYVGAFTLIAILAAYLIFRFARSYFRFRGQRLITCPETHQPAAVALDSGHLAREAVFGQPHLRLSECSRWPERQGCGQECLKQIEFSPEDCLVRTIVTKWYANRRCAACGRPIAEIEWLGHKPALSGPEGEIVQWGDVRPEELPQVLATHRPVCWDCAIAGSLRDEHPELVTVRPWRWKT